MNDTTARPVRKAARAVAVAVAATTAAAGMAAAAPSTAAAAPTGPTLAAPTGVTIATTHKTKRKRRRAHRHRVAVPARGARHRHRYGYRHARWAGDINVPGSRDRGNPVRSRWRGRVIVVRHQRGSYGKHVKVRHPNGRVTLYAHLSRTTVHRGQRVRYGQLVGRVGSTGNSSGPHLHFEVR